MQTALETWRLIYEMGDDCGALGLPAGIASEFSRLMLAESDIHTEESNARAVFLGEQMDDFLAKFSEKAEVACALGSMAFKPYVSGGEILVDMIRADRYVPTAFDVNGNVTAAVFLARKTVGKAYYTRLEFHSWDAVCGFSLYHVLAFFLIYSCTGWCLEVIFAAATTGQLVNRGFLNGPVCPIYGFGMIIVLFALTPLQDSVLLLYIGGVILPSALELVGGWALYKLYHTRWWDYSDFPFNIGGYICLEFSLLWGVGTLVVMRIVHPVVAGLVDMIPPFVGFVVMCVLYAVYAADVVVTAFAASGLAKTLDAMEQLADSIHAVSDAMTQLLGTTTLNADQKLDEQRLQLKLAAAEAREAAPKKRALRETLAAVRAKTEEAREAAKRASEIAKLNTAEAAKAAQLAAKGTMERAAELLRLEQLAEELQARSDEMQAQLLRTPRIVGPRRMLRAFPGLKHGVKKTTLKALRLGLARRESPEEEPKKNGSDTRKDA